MRFLPAGAGWGVSCPGGEQVLRLRARDGCFAAPAASWLSPGGENCACGRGMGSFVLRHE